MSVDHQKLVEQYRRDPVAASTRLEESLKTKAIKPDEIDLGKLFVECFGWHEFTACRSGKRLANDVFAEARLSETTGAVTTAMFQNITGQIVYSTVLDMYQYPEFVFTKLIPEVKTNFLNGEKIAGVTHIGDEIAIRNEADPYALAAVGEDWVFTPSIRDRGMIVPLTWEAVFQDRTGQLLEQAGKVGFWAGQNREKRAINCVIDENVTTHRYNWRGTVIASYGNNSGSHTWDNLEASNALLDWSDIDAVEQLFNAMLDPYTGDPIMIMPKHLVVTKQLEQTARRIISATEIRFTTPGFQTSGNATQTNMANPYNNKYEVVTSQLVAPQLATDTSWFLGDIGMYARCMVAEPMQVVQAPSNSHDEFHRRIVTQFRVNEQCAYTVVQPRAMCTATA